MFPAGSLGDEIQDAVRRPLWLKYRITLAARNLRLICDAAVVTDIAHPEFASIPGHVRVMPGEPGELRTVRTYTR